MPRSKRSSRRGVVLILVSGVVGLLLLLAMLFLQAVGLGSRATGTDLRAREEALAAEGAMVYAAARLLADPSPRWSAGAADRGDDWMERQGAENPSYAHGEPWIESSAAADGVDNDGDEEIDEPGEVDRIYVQGEQLADLDGDGRHSAWSGRLRCGALARGIPFSLRIESSEGKLHVNAGWLWQWDHDGRYDVAARPAIGNGIPDHRDVSANLTLATVLDGLGEALFERPELGRTIIESRPVGGYAGWEDLRRVLASSGFCAPSEIDRLRSFVDAGPGGLPGTSRCHLKHYGLRDDLAVSRYSPVCLWTARAEVLEGLWRRLSAETPGYRRPAGTGVYEVRPADDFPGERSGWDATNPFTGKPFLDFQLGPPPNHLFRPCPIRLSPAEGKRLAEAALVFRQKGTGGWPGLRRHWSDRARRIFKEDFDVLEGAGAQVLKWSWVAAKANLAFQAVAMDPCPGRGASSPDARVPAHSALWAGWGIDANPDVAGVQPPPSVNILPRDLRGRTQGLTLAPPRRFSVESRAGGASCEGTFRAGENLEVTTQEELEFLGGEPWAFWLDGTPGGPLAPFGVAMANKPSAQIRRDAPSGNSPRTVTLPRWNRRSLIGPITLENFQSIGWYGFSRTYGAVGLGTVEEGRGAAQLYWPLTEDFDPPNAAPPVPSWKEFWCDYEPSTVPSWSSLGLRPPFRLEPDVNYPDGYSLEDEPLAMSPYGFTNAFVRPSPGAQPIRGYCTTGDGARHRGQSWPPGTASARFTSRDPLLGFTIEARMGIGSEIHHDRESAAGTLRISTRRGWRAPATFGTELSVWCDFPLVDSAGARARKTRAWLVPDADRSGAWSHSVRLSMERVDSGLPVPGSPGKTFMKTRVTLFVNGSSGSADGTMSFLFDGMEPPSELGYPLTELGEIAKGSLRMRGFYTGIDELRMYDSANPPFTLAPRYVPEGTFTSPLYVLDAPADLDRAQWTGVFPPAGSIEPSVIGYRDAEGLEPLGTVPLGSAEEVGGLSPLRAARSFRYVVKLKGDPLVDEPALFESIWISLRRRGVSPAWTEWSPR